MGRIARFVKNDRPTIYHVISRSALPGLPIQANDKDYLLNLVRRLGKLYFVDILGFALMDNHFHLVVRVYPQSELTEAELRKRYKDYYGQDQFIAGELLDHYRQRLTSLGAFMVLRRMLWNFLRPLQNELASLSPLEEVLNRGSDEIDHGDECTLVPIAAGSGFGRLKEAIQSFEPGVCVVGHPAPGNKLSKLFERGKRPLNRLEQGLIFNLFLGVLDKMRNTPFGRLGRGGVPDPSEHFLDAKGLGSGKAARLQLLKGLLLSLAFGLLFPLEHGPAD
jgi:REP element-mobilizing transposase RayT